MAPKTPSRAESLGDVARWMRRRTFDLIVIGLVAIAGIVVGRELIQTYRAAPAEDAGLTGTLLEDQPLDLAFGSAGFAMSRQVVTGPPEEAHRALAGLVRRHIETALPASDTPDDDERTLVAHLLATTPFEEQSGFWALYGLDEDFHTQVGLRKFPEGEQEPHRGWRIVVWGLSFPLSEGRWTVYAVAPSPGQTPARSAPGEARIDESAFPTIPPGAQRTLRLVDREGQYLLGFSGPGPVDAWFDHFDQWFEAAGFRRTVAELNATRGQREYAPIRDSVAPRPARVQIARDGDGIWRGLVMGQAPTP
jgi:hypothetical protein